MVKAKNSLLALLLMPGLATCATLAKKPAGITNAFEITQTACASIYTNPAIPPIPLSDDTNVYVGFPIKDSKNEYLDASSLESPKNLEIVNVASDRLTPGKTANPWKRPIKIDSFNLILSFICPFGNSRPHTSAINITIPKTIKLIEINITDRP